MPGLVVVGVEDALGAFTRASVLPSVSRLAALPALVGLRDLSRSELDRWEDLARRMFVPFHGDRIIRQFAGCDELEAMLQGPGYDWTPDCFSATIKYDRAYTTHGSTLSALVHSWLLARSDPRRSWDLLEPTLPDEVSVRGPGGWSGPQ